MPLENPHQNRPEEPEEPEEHPKPQVAPGTRHIGRPAGGWVENKGGQTSIVLSHVGATVAVFTFPHAGCKSHCAIMICDQDQRYGVTRPSYSCRGLLRQ